MRVTIFQIINRFITNIHYQNNHHQMANQLSEEEKQVLEQLKQTSIQLEKSLGGVQLSEQAAMGSLVPEYSFDRRGNRLYKNSEVHENYQKATWGFKWLQLPYCKTCIFSKLGFWVVGAPFVGVTIAMIKTARSKNSKLGFKNIMRYSLWALAAGTAYTFVQNVFYNDYCDIDSYHYSQNANRSLLASKIKGTFKKP